MSKDFKLDDFKFKTPIPIRFSDIDLFGHANNAVFLTYFEQARTNYWSEIIGWNWDEIGIILAKAEVEFISPVFLTDSLYAYVKTSRVGNSSFDIEYLLVAENDGTDIIKANGKTIQVAFDYKSNKPTAIPDIYKTKMIEFDKL
jgi:acyl-CoA thioester hydrolase